MGKVFVRCARGRFGSRHLDWLQPSMQICRCRSNCLCNSVSVRVADLGVSAWIKFNHLCWSVAVCVTDFIEFYRVCTLCVFSAAFPDPSYLKFFCWLCVVCGFLCVCIFNKECNIVRVSYHVRVRCGFLMSTQHYLRYTPILRGNTFSSASLLSFLLAFVSAFSSALSIPFLSLSH